MIVYIGTLTIPYTPGKNIYNLRQILPLVPSSVPWDWQRTNKSMKMSFFKYEFGLRFSKWVLTLDSCLTYHQKKQVENKTKPHKKTKPNQQFGWQCFKKFTIDNMVLYPLSLIKKKNLNLICRNVEDGEILNGISRICWILCAQCNKAYIALCWQDKVELYQPFRAV